MMYHISPSHSLTHSLTLYVWICVYIGVHGHAFINTPHSTISINLVQWQLSTQDPKPLIIQYSRRQSSYDSHSQQGIIFIIQWSETPLISLKWVFHREVIIYRLTLHLQYVDIMLHKLISDSSIRCRTWLKIIPQSIIKQSRGWQEWLINTAYRIGCIIVYRN